MPFDAQEAIRRLEGLGVQTRPFYWPMHEQPVFRRMGLFANERYPVAERLARRGFYLPSGMALHRSTDQQGRRGSPRTPPMKIFGAYSRYYDLLYKSKDYAKEIAYVSRIIDRHASNARRLLDLGCGTGIHACAFAKAGYHVTAIDRSADMLEQARERARRELELQTVLVQSSSFEVISETRPIRLFESASVVSFHVISYLPKTIDLDAAFAQNPRAPRSEKAI